MNALLFLPTERIGDSRVVIKGVRANELSFRHELHVGLTITVMELGGRRGKGAVVHCSEGYIEIEVQLTLKALPRYSTVLIVAVPRPQTVKKVIHLATTSGIDFLYFIRSSNVEKSYLGSRALTTDGIQQEVMLGLEQAVDSCAPEIRIIEYFKQFIEEELPRLQQSYAPSAPLKLVADTRAEKQVGMESLVLTTEIQPVFVAIGPERGWSSYELEQFEQSGFSAISLGPRMLRVEIAAAFLLGQVQLLRELRRHA